MKLNRNRILDHVEALVDEAAKRTDLDGDGKRHLVTDQMIAKLDEQIEWPEGPVGRLAEAVDGPVLKALRGLVEALVQNAYDRHVQRQRGKLA